MRKKSADAYIPNTEQLNTTSTKAFHSRKDQLRKSNKLNQTQKDSNRKKQNTHLKCNVALGLVRQLKGTRDLLLQFD